jgi:hypothetical protein
MPDFSTDIDIDPSEFVDACSSSERRELIDHLIEGGYITEDQLDLKKTNHGVRSPNVNDETYWDALNVLMKSRHLLTLDEEQLIIKISDKFKYL